MIIIVLLVVGLALGSFVNALVWRIHEQDVAVSKSSKRHSEQSEESRSNKATAKAKKDPSLSLRMTHDRLSILKGRSMCPHCKHELASKDLVPVFSWLWLRGKCRYCGKPISAQYPVVEIVTALLFIASYIWWPVPITNSQVVVFALWLAILVGLIALLVYDLKWLLLPNRIIYPLSYLAGLMALIQVVTDPRPFTALINTILAVAVGGGIFYILFQVSKGKWIGGGDVRLGWLLGLIVGTPGRSLLFIFLAALLGSLVSIPLLMSKRLQAKSTIPFGPFLIAGAIITVLFGHDILLWYRHLLFVSV